jgi:hypothetical protein
MSMREESDKVGIVLKFADNDLSSLINACRDYVGICYEIALTINFYLKAGATRGEVFFFNLTKHRQCGILCNLDELCSVLGYSQLSATFYWLCRSLGFKDFDKVVQFMSTLYAGNRLALPLKGCLIIGY